MYYMETDHGTNKNQYINTCTHTPWSIRWRVEWKECVRTGKWKYYLLSLSRWDFRLNWPSYTIKYSNEILSSVHSFFFLLVSLFGARGSKGVHCASELMDSFISEQSHLWKFIHFDGLIVYHWSFFFFFKWMATFINH